ncbi:4-hydroxy-tetrahydrodipicolinate synthase [Thalassotalea agarivorans]|uniref:4-hydroxy-tetrahydrodipicolinate synthase n=1 Tax=Thalassotalea agarivorans TaxID=349064 RepID=A0A1I0HI17_THASX|nr:4-hydroxy-tetrahydrodipicolinate synthase [Thalassotalea agarivorans]SET83464.1 4-hydroxy-tetrahydrodipicolinate synthase [Thalassotalea agarivorans]
MNQFKSASLITAIKTPFLPSGEIDITTYDALMEVQIAAGVDGIVVGGTTGEGHLLSWEEHLMLIAHSSHKFGDRILIIGNTGSNNTKEAIKATKHGFAMGMHAALQINPYYGRTSTEGLRAHFSKVLEIGPTFIYNVPGRTGQDLTPEILKPLAHHENLIGIKECAGDERIAYWESRGVACWSGNDDQAFTSRHRSNSHGVISVTSNILPGYMRTLMDDANASELNESLTDVFDWLFCEPNPIALNTALVMNGAVKPVFKLPYIALNQEQRQQGKALFDAIKKTDIVGGHLKDKSDDDFIYVA